MLKRSLAFAPENDQATFAELPQGAGVFVLRGEAADEPYVNKAANLRRRVARMLGPPETAGISKRLNLRERVHSIEFAETASEFESTLLLYQTLRRLFPTGYGKRMRLSPPVVRIHWENAYPRAYVTRKVGARKGPRPSRYFGPFRSKAQAEKYLNGVLDLFKSRRCNFELEPDPAFPGCVYSEMKMCLAPCFKGCSDEEYFAEMERVERFLETRGESLLGELAAQRDHASAELDFEQAAAIHARIEKVKSAAREADELVHPLAKLDCVMVQPSATPDEVCLFRFAAGQFHGPTGFSTLGMLPALANERSGDSSLFGQPALMQPVPESGTAVKESRSAAEERLAAALEELQPEPAGTTQKTEQLALLNRWFHRSHKTGEIFFRETDGRWPLRRILNGVGRVFAESARR